MEERSMNETKKSAKRTSTNDASSGTLTKEELAALKETVKERKTAARRGKGGDKADGERDVLAKIAEMPNPDRAMAERIHKIVKEHAPELTPRTWYGMPAWANQAGKVVCFFTAADKFKSRYASFGFEEAANLDDGNMWPTAFALTKMTDAEEAKIAALVKKAAG
jgi:uncharacterized protein YdhG (YjbR/CyaY superfamily)